MVVDASGASFVTGFSHGGGSYDFLTVKYDANGRELWSARYDGPAHAYDEGTAIALGSEGKLYVAGSSEGPSTGLDFAVLQYDAATGDLIWSARLDGSEVPLSTAVAAPGGKAATREPDDKVASISVAPGGGVLVTGSAFGPASFDYLTAHFDATGKLAWAARYDGPAGSADHATALTVDPAGRVYVSGRSRGEEHFDITTIQYSPHGEQRWVQRYDGPARWYDSATAIALDKGGDLHVGGDSFGHAQFMSGVVLKYSGDGQLRWVARPFNQERSSALTALELDSAGNVFATGAIGTGNQWNFLTFKLNAQGALRWSSQFDGRGQGIDRATTLAVDGVGNAFVGGVSDMTDRSDCDACPAYTIVKYAAQNGEPVWLARYEGPITGANRPSAMKIWGKHLIVTGMSSGLGSSRGRIGDGPRDYATLMYRQVAEE